jgi:ketosteroid isomerase-like protein
MMRLGKRERSKNMKIVHRVTGMLALIAVMLATPALGAGGDKDLSATPQGKAYQALLKAVNAGDFDAYKKAMTKEARAGIDKQTKEMGLDAKKGMEILKMMTPSDMKYTSLKVEGKKAVLEATGKVDGEANKGTIALEQEDGQWKVANQSWTNAK